MNVSFFQNFASFLVGTPFHNIELGVSPLTQHEQPLFEVFEADRTYDDAFHAGTVPFSFWDTVEAFSIKKKASLPAWSLQNH